MIELEPWALQTTSKQRYFSKSTGSVGFPGHTRIFIFLNTKLYFRHTGLCSEGSMKAILVFCCGGRYH